MAKSDGFAVQKIERPGFAVRARVEIVEGAVSSFVWKNFICWSWFWIYCLSWLVCFDGFALDPKRNHFPTQNLYKIVLISRDLWGIANSITSILLKDDPQHLFDITSFAFASDFRQAIRGGP